MWKTCNRYIKGSKTEARVHHFEPESRQTVGKLLRLWRRNHNKLLGKGKSYYWTVICTRIKTTEVTEVSWGKLGTCSKITRPFENAPLAVADLTNCGFELRPHPLSHQTPSHSWFLSSISTCVAAILEIMMRSYELWRRFGGYGCPPSFEMRL